MLLPVVKVDGIYLIFTCTAPATRLGAAPV